LNIEQYEGCSQTNASYLIMSAHKVGGRFWWYGSEAEPSCWNSITFCFCAI